MSIQHPPTPGLKNQPSVASLVSSYDHFAARAGTYRHCHYVLVPPFSLLAYCVPCFRLIPVPTQPPRVIFYTMTSVDDGNGKFSQLFILNALILL
jgi:hypothetical protein